MNNFTEQMYVFTERSFSEKTNDLYGKLTII